MTPPANKSPVANNPLSVRSESLSTPNIPNIPNLRFVANGYPFLPRAALLVPNVNRTFFLAQQNRQEKSYINISVIPIDKRVILFMALRLSQTQSDLE